MAKHPHRLLLVEGRTWRCTLDGCSFFVHLGLQHILLSKRTVCWECGEVFIFEESNLKEVMPKCPECKFGAITESLNSVIK